MQQQALDSYQKDHDFILLSPTGSGKTLAFSLLILQQLKEIVRETQVLILVPTRELALQIEQVLRKVATGHKITCVYGGHSTRIEKNAFKDAPGIIIGTPGRIKQHLEEANFDPSHIHTLVLDEFDKSLELGFQHQMDFIIRHMPAIKSSILTSATMMDTIPEFTRVKEPVLIDFLNNAESAPRITIKKVVAPVQKKLEALLKLICKIGTKKMIIFCNHRDAVDHISELLDNRNIIHDTFHGGLEQQDRELALLKFRNHSNNVLITTDLAARGLDIPEVDAIIHYQLPHKEDGFIHRNGRTARMQAKGDVYVILKPEEVYPYIPTEIPEEEFPEFYELPENSPFATLYISAGRKDKINKIDIVGFLLNLGGIEKDDIGIIEVKDKSAYVAVRRKLASIIINKANGQKIKGRKIKIGRT
ncbi:DEAD/DEAH box helicase [Sphingobacterium sp.]|uniref:DEAD/DEAH box helicase n=1 Tax=Sphingobacterium sp. TaxID=341027 RepID=UPI002FDE23B6